jgi:diguanylate cyclase (GGDEF)-like protein
MRPSLEAVLIAAAASLAGRYSWVGIPLVLVVLAFMSALFGRRAAAHAGIVAGIVIAIAAVVNTEPGLALGMIAIYAISATAIVGFVGYIEDVQRQFQANLTELLDKLGLVVWEADPEHPEHTIVVGPVQRLTGADPGRFMVNAAGLSDEALDTGGRGGMVVRAREVVHEGATRWVEEALQLQRDLEGAVVRAHGSVRDITAVRGKELMLERFAEFVSAVPVGVIILRRRAPRDVVGPVRSGIDDGPDLRVRERAYDPAGETVYDTVGVNQAVEQLLDRPAGSLTTQPVISLWSDMRSSFPERESLRKITAAIDEQRSLTIEYTPLFAPGRAAKYVSVRVAPLPDESIAVVLEDVTDRHRSAAELAHRATHDALTGLSNRAVLLDHLDEHIDRSEGRSIPLLLLDLDQFKEVNDSFGHQQGDALLISVAERLRTAVPASAVVARLGGDEFAVLPEIGTTIEDAARIAQRIGRSLESPVVLESWLQIQTGASVGIASYPEHARDVSELVMRADVAMYAAKRAGKGHTVYASSLDRSSTRQMMLLGDLRRAIGEGELEMHIQPVVTASDRRVVAGEALVRWRHPEHGILRPPEFIELAEPTSLNRLVALEVAQQTVSVASAFQSDGLQIEMNLNLTARNLADEVVVTRLLQLVRDAGLPPGALGVELTERQLVDDIDTVRRSVERLRDSGIRFAIDDFGTGHSSLWTLRRLPCDELKLDRSFADDLGHGSDPVVDAVVGLAHHLGLVVVAEGVEDDCTMEMVTRLGCDRVQGFLVSPALTPEAFRSFVRNRASRTVDVSTR